MFRIDKENLHIVYSGLVFLVCYILLAVIAMRPIVSFDAFWHLQMGKDLLETGLSPWVDHYSFSYQGKVISSVPVLFQMLLHQFVAFFGESEGFYAVKLFYITLLMLALFVYFRKIGANGYIVLLLLPIIASAIHLRLIIRPEIFSNVLVVICLLLYLKAQKTFANKELAFVFLLLLFWANYHSPIIGYIIIFGLFLDKAINKLVNNDGSFSWGLWIFWGVAIFLIGFININEQYFIGQHFIVEMIKGMSNDFSRHTQEYKASYLFYSTNMLVHVSWVLSAYVAIWSLIKKQYGFVFIVLLLTYFSWATMRLVTVVMIVNMCILGLYLSQASASSHWLNIRSSVKNTLYVVLFFMVLLAFYFLGKEADSSIRMDENKQQILEKHYPVQVTDYLDHYQSGGNILNVMQFGGYLINKLSPDYKVYFDGRTNILYQVDFMEHNHLLWRNVDVMNDTIARYDIKYAFHENTPEVFAFLHESEKLNLGFADDNYLLFTKNEKNTFPLSSLLLVFPACWDDDWVQDIRKEIALSEELFEDKKYTLKYVLTFMKDYLSHEDKQIFFDSLQSGKMHSDGVRRLAFHLALNTANDKTVYELFTSIQMKTSYDLLIYSHHLAKTGADRFIGAENLLYYFYLDAKEKKEILSFDKIAIMYRILEILEINSKLQHFDLSYKDELEEKLKKVNFNVENDLSFDYICK